MAQTTTAINACDVVIELDDEQNHIKNISGSSNEIKMAFMGKTGDLQTFGGDFPVRLSCGRDAEFSLIAVYTTALEEARDIINEWYFGTGGLRTLRVSIPDASVGSDMYYGEVVLDKFDFTASSGDASPIKLNATLKPSGAWHYVKRGS
jgi:hypothetical protein